VSDGASRETAEEQEQRRADWIEETLSWSATKPILKPNRCYRVEIDVTTKLLKHDSTVSQPSSTTTARFKTGSPPSAAAALEPYVLWTQPAFEAGTIERRGYRGYDLGVLFNETYVDVMYVANGDDLKLQLFDNNGDPILDASGVPVVLPNTWGYAPERVLTREENVVTERIEAGGCLQTWVWQSQPLAFASPAGAGLLLRPETYHEVRVARANDAANTSLARYSFVTSRFATFSDMLGTFLPALALPRDGGSLSGVSLASADFATLAAVLPVLPSARPERFTVTPIRIAGSTHALLLDSPEPIEWRRVTAKVIVGSTTYLGAKIRVLSSDDEAVAFLIVRDFGQLVTLPDGSCSINLRFLRYIGSNHPIYSVQGSTTPEDVTLTFTLGPP
jgi:hypothetical protein